MLRKLVCLSKKRRVLGATALLLALLVWRQMSDAFAGSLFPIAWVIVAQLVFAGSFEAARLRRRAWLGQYLQSSSQWSRWLRGGVLMVLWHQLASAVLAAVLLVSLRLTGLLEMTLLLVGAGVCWGSVRWARKRLVRHIISGYLSAVTRRLLFVPVSATVAFGLIVASLARSQPYLVGMELGLALQEHIASRGQTLLGMLERSASALELASFWAVQNALNDLGVAGWAAVLGWAGVFAIQGVLAMSFVRLLLGATAAYDALQGLGEHIAVDGRSI